MQRWQSHVRFWEASAGIVLAAAADFGLAPDGLDPEARDLALGEALAIERLGDLELAGSAFAPARDARLAIVCASDEFLKSLGSI